MIVQQNIDATIKRLFEGIEFTAEPADLYDPLRYMIAIGGKRIRPRLVLTAYSLFRDEFVPGVLSPAVGLEVFHTFTLIHDDIMDRSPLRRGKETVWKKWSPDTAILSGDVMCIDSYSRMAEAPAEVLPEVLSLFSRTAAQVCDGQQYDMDFENRETVSMDEYMSMIGLKTAVLIACAAKMGAIIGGASKEAAEALYNYGYDLGLAFQVADDWLDAYGDSAVFGKPIGGDILNNKKCWLTVRAYEKGATGLSEALSLPSGTDAEKALKISRVKEVYEAAGVPTEAQAEIARLTEKALMDVSGIFPEGSEEYGALAAFAESLVGRTK